jgi:hypothetical protein
MLPSTDRMLKTKPRVQAQRLPVRKPQPAKSQMKPKKRRTPATIFPELETSPPRRPALVKREGKEKTAAPVMRRITPTSIARIAMRVTPLGLGGF